MNDARDPLSGIDMLANGHLKQRTVVLAAFIDDAIASHVISRLLLLDAEQPDVGISVYLDMMGGYIAPALAIADTIKFINAEVSTVAIGSVMAAGAAILAAGTAGKRSAVQTTRIQFGPPGEVAIGPSLDRPSRSDLQFWQKSLAEVIAEQTHHSLTTVINDVASGRTFTPFEAREYGIIDHVVRSAWGMPTAN